MSRTTRTSYNSLADLRELYEEMTASPAYARAFAGDIDTAQLTIADEPTSELDQGNVSVVLDALRAEAERGCVVVIATHDPAIVELADHHVAIDEGRLA